MPLRPRLHGDGGPQAGEVTRLGGVTRLSQRESHRTDRIKMKSNLGTLSFLLCFVLTITNFRETECIFGPLPSAKRNTVTFHEKNIRIYLLTRSIIICDFIILRYRATVACKVVFAYLVKLPFG